jgi:cellulose synthase/poly-beta-1,6-N-acetylglucosamine synthase-like glycosyltransferase
MDQKKPIYFLQMNPQGWKRASLPKLNAQSGAVLSENISHSENLLAMPWSQKHDYLNGLALLLQAKAWEEATGVPAETSAFTLIVPIHNEENSLPSFLSTLMLSNIPATAHIQMIFVTNACSDRSVEILKTFFSMLGEVELQDVAASLHDQQMDQYCSVVQRDHQRYVHINTARAGKAHALGLGNQLARQRDHLIAMSIDANNFIEPDALCTLFSHAYRAFRATPEIQDTVLFSGVGREAQKRSRHESVFGKTDDSQPHLVQVGTGVVNGWMMAWNTIWMESIGGPPEVALEDYALGVIARASGFKIEQATSVKVWGYVINDFKGLIDTRARYVRGKRQIFEYVKHDPAILSIIENEAFYMKKFILRFKYVLSKALVDPRRSAKYAATFVLWEYAIWKGMRAYKQNPTNQSWEKIEATY